MLITSNDYNLNFVNNNIILLYREVILILCDKK